MLADTPAWTGLDPDERCRDALLSSAGAADPSVLLSLSHGVAWPRSPFEERKEKQGSLALGGGELLTAEHVQTARFLPGGIWLLVACYGAGTPDRSAYARWLRDLADAGKVDAELPTQVLPPIGDPPFIAALPKAALANPQGPLAVIGHMDLAWLYSFREEGSTVVSRPDRFWSAQRALLRGRRVGPAFDTLLSPLRETNEGLLETYARIEATEDAGTRDLDRVAFAKRWMLRQDLRGYVLLGDPAARIAGAGLG